VVLFGERLPARQLATYQAETARGFDLVLSVGTTSLFPYIAGPVLDAHHLGRPVVEINPSETAVSEFATVKLPLRAAAALGAIWQAFDGRPGSSAAEPADATAPAAG
jgi:NAD-dependent deacetylase